MNLDKAINSIYAETAQKLFSKNYYELSFADKVKVNNYIFDHNFPKWKPVILYGNKTSYEISNIGTIRNISKQSSPNICNDSDGYSITKLQIGTNKWVTVKIHRLVAQAFIPNPDNKPTVNHIDGNKINNWVGNLEWATILENTQHAIQTGLFVNRPDITHTYTEEEIRNVCKLLEDSSLSCYRISKMTNVSKSVIEAIANKRIWKNISDEYAIPISRMKIGEDTYNAKCSELQIHDACELLMNPKMSYKAISEKTGVPLSTVQNLINGRCWKHITSQYTFPKKEHPHYNKELNSKTKDIIKWINDGYNKSEIIQMLNDNYGISNRQQANMMINYVLRKFIN